MSTLSPRWLTAAAVALLVAAFAVAPLNVSRFGTVQLTLILVYAVAILGLDVLIGWAGQVSLGQSAFFGIGAYVTGIAVLSGWPFAAGLIAGTVLATLVGALVAIPSVRLKGYALAMVTLALPVVAVPLAKRLESLTGGSQGLVVTVAEPPVWTGLDPDQWRFYLVGAVAGVVFLLVGGLLRGRFGRAFATIRASETLATAMGIPVRRYKVLAFAIAAACGGIAGALYIVAVQFISPDTLILTLSISMLASLVIGGLRSPLGALLGAAFFVAVPNVTGSVNAGQSHLLYGACLLAVMFLMPGGIAAAVKRAGHWALRSVGRRHRPSGRSGAEPAEAAERSESSEPAETETASRRSVAASHPTSQEVIT